MKSAFIVAQLLCALLGVLGAIVQITGATRGGVLRLGLRATLSRAHSTGSRHHRARVELGAVCDLHQRCCRPHAADADDREAIGSHRQLQS